MHLDDGRHERVSVPRADPRAIVLIITGTPGPHPGKDDVICHPVTARCRLQNRKKAGSP